MKVEIPDWKKAKYITEMSMIADESRGDTEADNVRKTIERVIKLCRDYFQPTKEQIALIQDHIIQCDSLKIMKMIAEMNCEKKALSNADRIRQMTDDELSVFLGGIADNCSYNTCDNCPMYGACVDVPISRDKWLKQEVSEYAGND